MWCPVCAGHMDPSLIGVTDMYIPALYTSKGLIHGLDYIACPYSILVVMITDTHSKIQYSTWCVSV